MYWGGQPRPRATGIGARRRRIVDRCPLNGKSVYRTRNCRCTWRYRQDCIGQKPCKPRLVFVAWGDWAFAHGQYQKSRGYPQRILYLWKNKIPQQPRMANRSRTAKPFSWPAVNLWSFAYCGTSRYFTRHLPNGTWPKLWRFDDRVALGSGQCLERCCAADYARYADSNDGRFENP